MLRGEQDYRSAISLLAVYKAIALNDALLIQLTGNRYKGKDHDRAADRTHTVCKQHGIQDSGLKHLRRLLSKKTEVSYGEQGTTFEVAQDLAETSTRFEAWVRGVMQRNRRSE